MRSAGKVVVPIAALQPLLQAWVNKNQIVHGGDGRTKPTLDKGITRLAAETGIPYRRISGILNDSLKQENVTFDVADRLLCAIQMTSAWHHELAEFYTELETAPYERHLEGNRVAA